MGAPDSHSQHQTTGHESCYAATGRVQDGGRDRLTAPPPDPIPESAAREVVAPPLEQPEEHDPSGGVE